MNDQLLVRILNGAAHNPEQPETLPQRKSVLVAILVDRLTLDVVHDDVRLTSLGRSAVHEPRDVRMLEGGQNLPFLPEPADDVLAGETATHEFDGNLLAKVVIGASGQEDRSHAADANLPDELVRPDALTDRAVRAREVEEASFEECPGRLAAREKLVELVPEIRVAGAALVEEGGALADRALERRVEQLPERPAFLGTHGMAQSTKFRIETIR